MSKYISHEDQQNFDQLTGHPVSYVIYCVNNKVVCVANGM